jgi:hypothetical protein
MIGRLVRQGRGHEGTSRFSHHRAGCRKPSRQHTRYRPTDRQGSFPRRLHQRRLRLQRHPGQVRFAIDINYNGTPGDPSDDVEVPDSFRIVRPSTGNSDLSQRDFCADLVEFTS